MRTFRIDYSLAQGRLDIWRFSPEKGRRVLWARLGAAPYFPQIGHVVKFKLAAGDKYSYRGRIAYPHYFVYRSVPIIGFDQYLIETTWGDFLAINKAQVFALSFWERLCNKILNG